EEVSTSPVDPLVAELEHFLQCVRGEEKPAVDGPQASRALLLADLIEQCVEQANICMTLPEPI
ncbi:MAG: gfo/Idh/MocA family oxidoreductase, partial [Vulcanococcus sp.]